MPREPEFERPGRRRSHCREGRRPALSSRAARLLLAPDGPEVRRISTQEARRRRRRLAIPRAEAAVQRRRARPPVVVHLGSQIGNRARYRSSLPLLAARAAAYPIRPGSLHGFLPPQGGPLFNRRKWSTFAPGLDIRVVTRREVTVIDDRQQLSASARRCRRSLTSSRPSCCSSASICVRLPPTGAKALARCWLCSWRGCADPFFRVVPAAR